jgi:hypothetical protein
MSAIYLAGHAIRRSVGIFFLLVAVGCFAARPAAAIDLSLCAPDFLEVWKNEGTPRCGAYVWASGSIVPGDYDKLREFLRHHRDEIFFGKSSTRTVAFVGVSGGDHKEGIRIGLLMRRLELATQLGMVSNDHITDVRWGVFRTFDKEKADCIGACVLAWVGGSPRTGWYRVGFDYVEIKETLAKFVKAMRTPDVILERWLRVERDKVDMIPPRELLIDWSDIPEGWFNLKYAGCDQVSISSCGNNQEAARLSAIVKAEFPDEL